MLPPAGAPPAMRKGMRSPASRSLSSLLWKDEPDTQAAVNRSAETGIVVVRPLSVRGDAHEIPLAGPMSFFVPLFGEPDMVSAAGRWGGLWKQIPSLHKRLLKTARPAPGASAIPAIFITSRNSKRCTQTGQKTVFIFDCYKLTLSQT